ncbi:MAG: 30S ribosome-binding factor RbfA [Lachnospiraceae bacterium]|jgi:ribosome-binding factor A|nr:30S ribosome-binding factor RbfA [Lachnospiraceae bacterium]MBF1001834.1 30S ribosome-binding factor RbfA [Lachnospiraceae bacterium]MBF1004157.1 30S ribosome-binding factor RbfA [Lachnospiraceae bacterium]MBF1011778.1 30S ribosome-binding factor RbfA [Lachnospiraceae bacterium]MBF1017748.1 30S ribosome-binding factor RbfA [Lachnospiraceae bacterium]
MKKNRYKNIRINSEVKKVISEAIRFSKDPRISPMTSVMEVVVAPDLKTCKVWVSVLGEEEDRKSTMEGLKSASGYIRSTLARELNLRNTPELRFIMDASVEYAIRMSKRIDEVMEKDEEARRMRGEDRDEDREDDKMENRDEIPEEDRREEGLKETQEENGWDED